MTFNFENLQNFYLNGVEIPYIPEINRVAVSLSGGADSAMLTYILCQISTIKELHCISHIRMWKTRPWQAWDSLKVFNWFVEKFPNKKFKRHTNFIAPDIEYGNVGPKFIDEYGKNVSGDNIQIRSFAEYICYLNGIDVYYNAVTRNPKNVILGGMKERDVDPTDNNQHLRIMKHMEKWALHPFRFIEKTWIIQQYKHFNIEELFHLTRSCEGEFENLNYKNYIPYQEVPICDNCFWCRERRWAVDNA